MLVAIDMGSSTTRIAVGGKGLVLAEPTLLADCCNLPQALAVGQAARPMQGKVPEHMAIYSPVQAGHLASPGAAQMLLRNLLQRVGASSWRRPAVRLVIPSQATPVERQQLRNALQSQGLVSLHSVSLPVACAYGAFSSPTEGERLGVALLDIGSHVTEMSIVASDIVMRQHISWGSSDLDRELRECLNQEFELEVSAAVSERLKCSLGCFDPETQAGHEKLVGRERSTGLPVERELPTTPLAKALDNPLQKLVELTRRMLDQLPPLLAKDVLEKGIMLTGGGSLLRGLPAWLSQRLELPVTRAEDPQNCSVLGALKCPQHLCRDV